MKIKGTKYDGRVQIGSFAFATTSCVDGDAIALLGNFPMQASASGAEPLVDLRGAACKGFVSSRLQLEHVAQKSAGAAAPRGKTRMRRREAQNAS